MKILLGTKIYLLHWRNYVKSRCVITGFHCILKAYNKYDLFVPWHLLLQSSIACENSQGSTQKFTCCTKTQRYSNSCATMCRPTQEVALTHKQSYDAPIHMWRCANLVLKMHHLTLKDALTHTQRYTQSHAKLRLTTRKDAPASPPTRTNSQWDRSKGNHGSLKRRECPRESKRNKANCGRIGLEELRHKDAFSLL